MTFPLVTIIFYIFAFVAIAAAVAVVLSNNPVHAVLALVLAFFASAGIWLIAQAEFLALILILVYVGAVMTLFLFVIMMLNIDAASMKKTLGRYIPIGLIIVVLLTVLMFVAIRPENFNFAQLANAHVHAAEFSNIKQLGLILYTNYAYAFELAAVLLLIAIIAAITLSHRPSRECKTQKVVEQMRVRRQDRVRIVKMPAEKRD